MYLITPNLYKKLELISKIDFSKRKNDLSIDALQNVHIVYLDLQLTSLGPTPPGNLIRRGLC